MLDNVTIQNETNELNIFAMFKCTMYCMLQKLVSNSFDLNNKICSEQVMIYSIVLKPYI